MASFASKVKKIEAVHCSICRNKKTAGRYLADYQPTLDFVCEDCYKRYFGRIAHIEKKGFTVLYRPADIVEDEYRQSHIFAPSLVFDMVKWCASCGVMWLIFLGLNNVYGEENFVSFALIPTALFSLFSLFGVIKSVYWLVKGLFGGMDHKRRLLLLAKILLYCVMMAMHGAAALSWFSGMSVYFTN